MTENSVAKIVPPFNTASMLCVPRFEARFAPQNAERTALIT
jgi:hypothetical protein